MIQKRLVPFSFMLVLVTVLAAMAARGLSIHSADAVSGHPADCHFVTDQSASVDAGTSIQAHFPPFTLLFESETKDEKKIFKRHPQVLSLFSFFTLCRDFSAHVCLSGSDAVNGSYNRSNAQALLRVIRI